MEMRLTLARLVWEFDMRAGPEMEGVEWENDARFEGFWNIPKVVVRFEERVGGGK